MDKQKIEKNFDTMIEILNNAESSYYENFKYMKKVILNLVERSSKFKIGDRVELTEKIKYVVITKDTNWGWLGIKQDLYPGAKGTIKNISFYENSISYEWEPDNCTYVSGRPGHEQEIKKASRPYQIGFTEEYFRKTEEQK